MVLDHDLVKNTCLSCSKNTPIADPAFEPVQKNMDVKPFDDFVEEIQHKGLVCTMVEQVLGYSDYRRKLNNVSVLEIKTDHLLGEEELGSNLLDLKDRFSTPRQFASFVDMISASKLLDEPIFFLSEGLYEIMYGLKEGTLPFKELDSEIDKVLNGSVVVTFKDDQYYLSGSIEAISRLCLKKQPGAMRLTGATLQDLVQKLAPLIHKFNTVLMIDTAVNDKELPLVMSLSNTVVAEKNKISRIYNSNQGMNFFGYYKQQYNISNNSGRKKYEGEVIDLVKFDTYRIPSRENLSRMWHDRYLVFLNSLGDYSEGFKVIFSSPFSQILRLGGSGPLYQGTAVSVGLLEDQNGRNGFEDVGDLLRVLSRRVSLTMGPNHEIV